MSIDINIYFHIMKRSIEGNEEKKIVEMRRKFRQKNQLLSRISFYLLLVGFGKHLIILHLNYSMVHKFF